MGSNVLFGVGIPRSQEDREALPPISSVETIATSLQAAMEFHRDRLNNYRAAKGSLVSAEDNVTEAVIQLNGKLVTFDGTIVKKLDAEEGNYWDVEEEFHVEGIEALIDHTFITRVTASREPSPLIVCFGFVYEGESYIAKVKNITGVKNPEVQE